MVDIQTISIATASAGVFVAAIYYVLQIRHQTRLRESEVILKLSSWFVEERLEKAYDRVWNCEFEDYDDFVKKYGSLFDTKAEKELKMAIGYMLNYMDTLGLLLKRKIVDVEVMYEMYRGIRLWEKLKPIIEGGRKELNDQDLWYGFEYHYHQMKKIQASKKA